MRGGEQADLGMTRSLADTRYRAGELYTTVLWQEYVPMFLRTECDEIENRGSEVHQEVEFRSAWSFWLARSRSRGEARQSRMHTSASYLKRIIPLMI